MSTDGRGNTFDVESGEMFAGHTRKKENPQGEWECMECGHIRVGRKPPEICPDCGASREDFEFWEYEYDDGGDSEDHD